MEIPTWKGIVPHEKARGNGDGGTVGGPKVESSKEPFMAPSGLDLGENIGSTSVTGKNILFAIMWQVWRERWVVHRSLELVVKLRMMESMSRSDSQDGCSYNCSRCVGRSFGDAGKEVEELSAM